MAVATHPQSVSEITTLRLTAGSSSDGETIAMTAATQPSLEDVLRGAIPWLPRVRLHDPLLAPAVGDEFLAPFYRGAAGDLGQFILVVEGSIPDESGCHRGGYYEQGEFADEYGSRLCIVKLGYSGPVVQGNVASAAGSAGWPAGRTSAASASGTRWAMMAARCCPESWPTSPSRCGPTTSPRIQEVQASIYHLVREQMEAEA